MSDKEECKRKRRTEHGDKEEGKREDINFQIFFSLVCIGQIIFSGTPQVVYE